MVCDLTTIPIEVQETILTNLSGQSLLQVSRVCRLWHSICEWIAREKFFKIIPEECVKEIEHNEKSNSVWLTAVNNYFLQKYLINNMLDYVINGVVELNKNHHLCFCVYEPLIFIGCESGEIEIYNPEERSPPVLVEKRVRKPIIHIEVMKNKNLLLAKTGRNDLEFFSLPYFSEKSWVYKMTHLIPKFQNYSHEFNCESNFSISGHLLATVVSAHEVSVFHVEKVTNATVELKFLTNYIANEVIGCIGMWGEEIIIVFKTGEILQWNISTQVTILSDRYHEIFNQNPVWIFHGRIFCSTFISSQFLGYLRMNQGTNYWLVGNPTCDLVRCQDLGTMITGDNGIVDVLCVCLKQRLLACGTRDGKILLYYLSDKFFSSDELNLNGNEHLKKEFDRIPDLTIRTKERPLRHIQIQFCENSIKIYAWPYLMISGPGLKGCLQCIILKEGGWVQARDKESIDV